MNLGRRQFSKTAFIATAGSFAFAQQLFPQDVETIIYTVRNGDTLGHIALRHKVSAADIRTANDMSGDLIRVGQKLRIPKQKIFSEDISVSGETYTVKRGDTLGGIALANGLSLRELKRANQLSTDKIRVGQKLVIPTSQSTDDFLKHVRESTAQIEVRRDNWKRIVVHHSAIKYGNAAVYDRAHRKRGMQNGLAYHFLIGNGIDSGDGEIEIGPRWKKQLLGGHVKNYRINLTAIGICLIGNFQANHPTRRQMQAFTQLMDWLRSEVVPGATQFAGHRDLRGEQTICPGKNFPLAAMHARYD